MTFKIDNDALKRAMMRHYDEKLAKELREMFVYSPNPESQRVWQIYMEEIRKKQLRQARYINMGKTLTAVIVPAVLIYGMWAFFAKLLS